MGTSQLGGVVQYLRARMRKVARRRLVLVVRAGLRGYRDRGSFRRVR